MTAFASDIQTVSRCAECGAPGDFPEYGGVCWGCVQADLARRQYSLTTIKDVMDTSDDEIYEIGTILGLPMDKYSPDGHRIILLGALRITD